MVHAREERPRTKSIVIGVVEDRCCGSLAFALEMALEESATVRIVRVSDVEPLARISLRLPVTSMEVLGDPLDELLKECVAADVMVIEAPRGDAASLIDPLLLALRRQTETLVIEVDHRGEVVHVSGNGIMSSRRPSARPVNYQS